MSWFHDQIEERVKNDDERFAESFANMSSVVMGKSILNAFTAEDKQASDAIAEILSYYYIKMEKTDETFPDLNEKLEYYMRPHGIMRRSVRLTKGWYKDCVGALLGKTKEGSIIALLPGKVGGYTYFDYKTGRHLRLR